LRFSKVRPLALSTHSPPIKFLYTVDIFVAPFGNTIPLTPALSL
jgi:hypothetical protein